MAAGQSPWREQPSWSPHHPQASAAAPAPCVPPDSRQRSKGWARQLANGPDADGAAAQVAGADAIAGSGRGGSTASRQAGWSSLMARRERHTALLHLKPDPKAICHTRSPRLMLPILSMLPSTYLQEHTPSRLSAAEDQACMMQPGDLFSATHSLSRIVATPEAMS